ncbi:MAG: hypothetical protein ACYC08_08635, partial [Armatimonadota bacterium]
LYLDYPAHRDLFGNMSLDRSFDGFNVGLNLYGSSYSEGTDSYSGDLYMQTHARDLGKLGLKYTLSARSAYSHAGDTDGMAYNVQSRMYTPRLGFGKEVSATGSLSLGYQWGEIGTAGLSTLASAVVDWNISPISSLQLSYRYADRASVYSANAGKQSLSAFWHLNDYKRWSASLYAIKGLDYSTLSVFGDVSYRLDPKWRFGVRATMSKYGDTSYDDLELALGRNIGSKELVAVWSKSQHKVMLELGSVGF